ncbi:universal stress protein [Streptomyces olivaceus]|uniref:universal stress protein n=1 Tax=Streptomyces olivaceus TaxID=47716 RepID=UPI001CCDDECB|nr:universal stress protein [Streptomyces olivaceus]MBZ6174622.1 universal stress protein [Streptomyces olivaceus]MBZ6180801.1 universal stress protein [Streptomyces olivaceus]
MNGFMVVGVDGSAPGLEAVGWAAQEAEARNVPLQVVHALARPAHLPLDAALPRSVRERFRVTADAVVEEALLRARAEAPHTEVSGLVIPGEPRPVLVAQARSAAMAVVGHKGLNAFPGTLLGSVAAGLAAHAECPVVVVREPARPAGPVVLGIDGSAAGAAAVRFAFQEASVQGADITAVHAWTAWNAPMPPPADETEPYAYGPGMLAAEEERLLAETLAGMRTPYPDVRVERSTVHGPARPALIEASRTARLTVVGSRGRGGFVGLLLGSVSQAVLHHAHSPVAVVRA